MKIRIIGVGALGSLFGGRLARAGADVELLIRNQAHRQAINRDGLHMSLDDGEHTVAVPAIRPSDARGPTDLIILLTKTFHSAAALESVRHLLDDPSQPRVMSVQNGLGNRELIARFVPESRIIYGMSTTPADLVGPGRVASHGPSQTIVMSGDHKPGDFLNRVCQTLTDAGLPCAADPDIQIRVWEKVAFNCAMNAVPGVTRTTAGSLRDTPDALELARNIASEACKVANAAGVNADPARVHAIIAMACEKHPDHICSLLGDLLARRPTEVDSLNGAVVAVARQHGLSAPLNDTMASLLRLAEKSTL